MGPRHRKCGPGTVPRGAPPCCQRTAAVHQRRCPPRAESPNGTVGLYFTVMTMLMTAEWEPAALRGSLGERRRHQRRRRNNGRWSGELVSRSPSGRCAKISSSVNRQRRQRSDRPLLIDITPHFCRLQPSNEPPTNPRHELVRLDTQVGLNSLKSRSVELLSLMTDRYQ